jgi:hypothetical protein
MLFERHDTHWHFSACLPTTSRFHNLSGGAHADALGHADAVPATLRRRCRYCLREVPEEMPPPLSEQWE